MIHLNALRCGYDFGSKRWVRVKVLESGSV